MKRKKWREKNEKKNVDYLYEKWIFAMISIMENWKQCHKVLILSVQDHLSDDLSISLTHSTSDNIDPVLSTLDA